MESVLAAIVSVALILFATLTVTQGALSTADLFSENWKAMEERSGEIARTEITITDVATASGQYVDSTVENAGSVSLGSFSTRWDVIVQYYDGNNGNYYIIWAPYTSSNPPGDNQWTVEGIYLAGTSTPEVYEPGILNPGEEVVIRFKANPVVGLSTTNRITVAASNGVTTSAIFTR